MRRERRRCLVTGRFQLIAAQTVALRFREVQSILIEIKTRLLVIRKSASDPFDGFNLALIQFDALTLNRPRAGSWVALSACSALCFAARLP